MTKEHLAALLTGREIGEEIATRECVEAKKDGLVVVFGASDDLVEFRGAIHDEQGCFGGGEIFVTADGPMAEHERRCECPYCGFAAVKSKAKRIEAVWDKDGYSWTYKTEIPHATFEIAEGDQKYCRGIIFSIDDLSQ